MDDLSGAPIDVDDGPDDGGAPPEAASRLAALDAARREKIRSSPPPVISLHTQEGSRPSEPAGDPEPAAPAVPGQPGEQTRAADRLPEPTATGDDAAAKWLEINGKDQAKANAEALALNNRAAKLADENRQLQERLRQLGVQPAPEPEVPGDAADPAPPAPEPIQIDPAEVDRQVKELAQRDSVTQHHLAEYKASKQELDSLIQFDQHGRITGGEIPKMQGVVAHIERALEPERFGLPIGTLDEITAEEYRGLLQQTKANLERALWRRDMLADKVDRAYRAASNRVGLLRADIQKELARSAEARQSKALRAKFENDAVVEWEQAVKVATEGYTPEEQRRLNRVLMVEADIAMESGQDIPDFRVWVKQQLPAIAQELGIGPARRAVDAARAAKRAVGQPAPRGAAAVASDSRPEALSARDRLREANRATAAKARVMPRAALGA